MSGAQKNCENTVSLLHSIKNIDFFLIKNVYQTEFLFTN